MEAGRRESVSQAFSATLRVAYRNFFFLVSPSYRRVRRRLHAIEKLPHICR